MRHPQVEGGKGVRRGTLGFGFWIRTNGPKLGEVGLPGIVGKAFKLEYSSLGKFWRKHVLGTKADNNTPHKRAYLLKLMGPANP